MDYINREGLFIVRRIASLFAIPILGVLSIGLFVCTLIAIVGGLLYTFGVEINMEIWPDIAIPQLLGLPVSLVFGAVLLFFGILTWRLLRYFITL